MLNHAKNTVLKLQERSPLKYVFVFLIPRNIVNNQADAISMFRKIIDKLHENKHLAPKESDNTKLQYKEFINDVVSRCQEDFLDFDMSSDCLDHFFGRFLNISNKHKDLWKAIQIHFVMPNCQAHIERGFSINNEMVIENLESDSLCALRLG